MLGEDALNTFSEKTAQHHADLIRESTDIQLITLNDVVDQYNSGKFPDFLDIDIEGLDFDVLNACDFTKSSPKVICVEEEGKTLARLNKMMLEKPCKGDGYVPYCRIPEHHNIIYVRRDIYNSILGL